MNAARFFKEERSWESLTGSNSYTGDTFTTAQTIRVRGYIENELVRDKDGNETVTSERISTTTAVGLGDRITDAGGTERRVIQVRENADTRGNFSHYVAWLK